MVLDFFRQWYTKRIHCEMVMEAKTLVTLFKLNSTPSLITTMFSPTTPPPTLPLNFLSYYLHVLSSYHPSTNSPTQLPCLLPQCMFPLPSSPPLTLPLNSLSYHPQSYHRSSSTNSPSTPSLFTLMFRPPTTPH